MSGALLAVWMMLIGADRIDLIGGAASFFLTPYLALTPIVVVAEAMRRHRDRRSLRVSRVSLAYAAIAGALVTVALASVVGARDQTISAARTLLLATNVSGTFAVVIMSADRPDLPRIFARAAIVSLALYAAFDVMEGLWWIGRASETMRFGTIVVHFGALQNVGPIPRLAGPVSDANRGGFVLLVFGLLISHGEPRPIIRRIALTLVVLFLLLTISRSAWLGALAMTVALAVRQRGRAPLVPRAPLVAALLVLMAGAATFLAKPDAARRAAAAFASPVASRLSSGEGSARSHLALIERGIADATESIPTALIGLGYGNSHLVLQDFFPGNKYGNFHSLYVSMFAESGVVALWLTLMLLIAPLIGGGPWRPLIAGAVVFNVFYQTPTEPAFWFVLAAAWLTMPTRFRRRM